MIRTARRRGEPGSRPAFDPRLAIGMALVLVSVAGVVGVMAAADRGVDVVVAAAPLSPGDRVTADDLVQRRVVLDGAHPLYLAASDVSHEGVVITRPIAEGELVPVSATGDPAELTARAVVVRVGIDPGSGVTPGRAVDIWAATPAARGEAAPPPAVVAADAVVVEVRRDAGIMPAGDGVEVELLVPRERVADVLQAVADDTALSLVPASGAGAG